MRSSTILLALVLAAVGSAALGMSSTNPQQENKPDTTVAKQMRWRGRITLMNKDESNFTIRGGSSSRDTATRKVFFDSTTRWTKGGEPAEQAEFNEGSYVFVYGKADPKGHFQATEVDLRPGR
jgi:hypothetical protein